MSYKYIFAFDPSGNWHEGKGTTGWALMDWNERLLERGYIRADEYGCPEAYWQAHVDLIHKYNKLYKDNLIIVIEDYVLYRDQAMAQTNSKMETCRLIGLLQWKCWRLKQPYTMQLAASVKQRWADELLYREGILRKDGTAITHVQSGLNMNLIQSRDAFRHALHYAVTRNDRYIPYGERVIPHKPKVYRKKKGYFMTSNYGGDIYDDSDY